MIQQQGQTPLKELDDEGRLLGIEILNASTFLRDSILESVEAKVLHLAGA